MKHAEVECLLIVTMKQVCVCQSRLEGEIFGCADSALDFARQRIAGVKRSREMLAPLKAGGLRVFAPARAFKLS